MGKFRVSLNGYSLPEGMKVREVRHSILPPISQGQIVVPHRAGTIPSGNNIDTRKIEMDIIVVTRNENEMPKYANILANWLYYEVPKKLEIEDVANLGRYYMAMYNGDSTIEEIGVVGNTTITFYCYDPFAYAEEESQTFYANEVIRLSNLGDRPIYPKVQFKVNRNLTNLLLVGSSGYVELGSPMGVDSTTDNYAPYIVSDTMSSLAGWTQSPAVYGGYIDIPLNGWTVYNNQSFRIRDWKDDGTGWHGGAIQKQGDRAINDFEMIAPISFNGQSERAKGVIQTNVLSESGGFLCTIQYKDDNSDASMCHIDVRLHGGNTVQSIMSYRVPNNYTNFTGAVYVTRKGNRWDVDVKYKHGSGGVSWIDRDPSKLSTIQTASYVDGGRIFSARARIVQLACMMNGTYTDSDEDKKKQYKRNDMKFWNIYLKDISPYVSKPNVVPTIIYSGDMITINNETGEIFKNDELFMDFLDPTSPFIKLSKSENALTIEPNDCYSSGTITYTPKFL